MHLSSCSVAKETMGHVLEPPDVGATFIFAQQWPSLAFTADALGLPNIYTCVDWQSAIAREEFKATSLGGTLHSWHDLHKLMDDSTEPVVLIQGDIAFATDIIELFKTLPCFVTCAFISAANNSYVSPTAVWHLLSNLTWRQASHKSMVGATMGSWLFGSSVNLNCYGGLQKLPLAGHSLMHVLKTT